MSKVNAIILAGAFVDPEMGSVEENISRAMIKIGDKTMMQWVVDALRGAPSVGRIVAVGDVSADGLDGVIEPGSNLVENMKRGIDSIDSKDPLLIVSSDIPLLTQEAVEDFINRAEPLNADMVYPIIKKENCEKRHPEFKRTYLKTREGTFTGGNVMLLKPEFITRNWDTIAEAYEARKHKSQLARMIGIGMLIRMVIGQALPFILSVSALERAASRMLNAKVRAVVSDYSEIGEDIDKPSDVVAVRKILAAGGSD